MEIYAEIIGNITDIHTHFGPYAGREFSIEEILAKAQPHRKRINNQPPRFS